MKKQSLIIISLFLLIFTFGCSREQQIPLDKNYKNEKLNLEISYPSSSVVNELEDGAQIALPSGKVFVYARRIDNIVNFDEALTYLKPEAKSIKDITFASDLKGKSGQASTGSGKEKVSTSYNYSILGGKLYLTAVEFIGNADGKEKKLAQSIAESFKFIDDKQTAAQTYKNESLNISITYPGDCTLTSSETGLKIALPDGKTNIELLSLKYEGGAEEIVEVLKSNYVSLKGKKNFKISADKDNPKNGQHFSLDYEDSGSQHRLDLLFTAFNNRVYAMGNSGEPAELERWSPTIKNILNNFSFIKQGEQAPEVSLIKERNIPSYIGAPLPKGEPLSDSELSSAVLLGDSLTYGFEVYKIEIPAKVVANESINVGQFSSTPVIETPSGKATMLDCLLQANPSKIYIMLGINSIGLSKEAFLSSYQSMIDQIKDKLPNAEIYLESIMPVTKSRSGSTQFISNERINEFNAGLLELCWKNEIYYVDIGEAFRNETGSMPENLSADGIHIGPGSYKVWFDYLRTHH